MSLNRPRSNAEIHLLGTEVRIPVRRHAGTPITGKRLASANGLMARPGTES